MRVAAAGRGSEFAVEGVATIVLEAGAEDMSAVVLEKGG